MNEVRLKKLGRHSIIAVAAAAIVASAPAQAEPLPDAPRIENLGLSAERLKRIDAKVQDLVDRGEVKGMVTLFARHGKVVSFNARGQRDDARPMTRDTIFRIASMSKPVTGVALMLLFEEGKFTLDDPITKFVPEFAGLKVATGTDKDGNVILVPMKRPPTMRELMSHRAGFGYGMFSASPADKIFAREAPFEAADLKGMIDRLARVPLLFQPGEHFSYSASVDVEGYIIEKLSGRRLGEFMRERIFAPLHMSDTGFFVPPAKMPRLAAMYRTDPATGQLNPVVKGSAGWREDHDAPPALESGGGGLYSTVDDYSRFAQMLANKGELAGARILAPSTVELLQSDSLPRPLPQGYVQTMPWMFGDAMGFGLNMQTAIDPRAAGRPEGKGTLSWNGSTGVFWWADPANDIVFLGLAQNSYRTGPRGYDIVFRQLAYQALVDPAK